MDKEQIINSNKAKKLLFVDIVFSILDFIIAFSMFKLWFWLFSNKIILTTLIIITLLGLIRQIWKTIDNLRIHWQLYKNYEKK